MESQTVVVTGASAGIGRATARLFGQRGARVALIARGQAGLDGAARDVEEAGGQALAISADVADYDQVTAAARQAEQRLGPIDVWVNVAFTSVFAPFREITAEEFRRVTEVSYLGFVHGTMAALALMRPRGRGTIVQVGSALGERSIPLQSAYCGAKHAINGFTSSLRCELLHEKSGVQVTVVQMPAVNTPQFSWVRSRLPNHPQPVPPIYQPEVAARGVLFAADHPGRRQYWVGASTMATILANRVVPGVLDRYLARTGYRSQQTGQAVGAGRPDNLLRPVDGGNGGEWPARGLRRPVPRPQPAAMDRPACPGSFRAAGRGGPRRRVRRGMARTPPVTTSSPGRGLQMVRAAYGAALILAPGPVIRLATRRLPSRRTCRVARVLGTRHLIQAALTAAAPGPAVLAIGGQVDAAHAASMLLLAAVSRPGRRAALTDALTEAALAAAGFTESIRAPEDAGLAGSFPGNGPG